MEEEEGRYVGYWGVTEGYRVVAEGGGEAGFESGEAGGGRRFVACEGSAEGRGAEGFWAAEKGEEAKRETGHCSDYWECGSVTSGAF